MKQIFKIFQNPFSTQVLLIELKDEQLILAEAKKSRLSSGIYIINVLKTSIDQTIFRNGIIYQPSAIESRIKAFLNTQKLTNPQTFVSIPNLVDKHDLILVMAIFQAALCISKTEVKISSITDSPIFDEKENLISTKNSFKNLLDLLGHDKIRSPWPWLLSSATCILAIVLGLRSIINKNTLQISSLKNHVATQQCTTDKLNGQIKNFAQVKESNDQIKHSLSKFENSYIHTQNPFDHIVEISCKIPATDYLTKINFSKRPAATTNPIPNLKQKTAVSKQNIPYIELEGQTKSIQSANRFIQHLAKNTNLFKKIDILYVKKIKYLNKNKTVENSSKNALPKYQFKAVGELKYIC